MLWKLKPFFSKKIWGSEKWLFSTHPNGEATLVSGPLAGKSLAAACKHIGVSPPPLLIKIIEAHDDLSVQVHPDDAYARSHEHTQGNAGNASIAENGKSECWFFLEHRPGASVISGFTHLQGGSPSNRKPSAGDVEALRENLRKKFRSQDREIIEPSLRKLPVEQEAALYIPAGTIHSIGAGIKLLEVQQSSDITYRLYDFERGRETHLEQAMDVLDPYAQGEYFSPEAADEVHTPYFHVSRLRLPPGETQTLHFSPHPYPIETLTPATTMITTIAIVLSGALSGEVRSTPQTMTNMGNIAHTTNANMAPPEPHAAKDISQSMETPFTLDVKAEDCMYAPVECTWTCTNKDSQATATVALVSFPTPPA